MSDNEVQYASDDFRNKRSARGLLSDKEAKRRRLYQKLFYCFGILYVISVMAFIGVRVYYLNNKISSDFKTLAQNFTSCKKKSSHLNIQVQNLTQQQNNLTAEISQVKQNNHDLQTKIKTLREEIKTCEDQKLSQVLQIIDEYCPKENNGRRYSSCPKGWIHSQSSCYAVNDAVPRNQKTWEEAREDCRRKSSDLTIVGNEEEKKFVDGTSWKDGDGLIKGFWIGLRVEGGKWKWMDGSDLTNQAWINQQPATDGQCVTSLQNQEWTSVSCTKRNGWICEKKALSV
ncbi:C-type lectin domain family 10 member A-like [Xiphophorus hellerii]|uniref:C-type lectin domain family 10 member A-like n=1 Tax=Xiphophorus hellerii TaxID=8084 RepID=UPI0013B3E68B|nr:C-type lectin domain family 10 member A-like [Xiphophorus hellerii]